MGEPCIISVAVTGSVPRKKDNPAVPITIPEQVESTQAAYEAGAALVHVHVRNADESSSSDPEKFAALQEGIRSSSTHSQIIYDREKSKGPNQNIGRGERLNW